MEVRINLQGAEIGSLYESKVALSMGTKPLIYNYSLSHSAGIRVEVRG